RRARGPRFRGTVICTGAAPTGQNRHVRVSSPLAVTRTLRLRTAQRWPSHRAMRACGSSGVPPGIAWSVVTVSPQRGASHVEGARTLCAALLRVGVLWLDAVSVRRSVAVVHARPYRRGLTRLAAVIQSVSCPRGARCALD